MTVRSKAMQKTCPKCDAAPGERCRGKDRYRRSVHRDRILAPQTDLLPPRSRRPRVVSQGWVYFIRAQGTGYIKIGFSQSHPNKRLRALQTGSADTLELLAFIAGDQAKERELHRRFEHLRIRGEWFHDEQDLSLFVDILRINAR